MAGSPDVVDLTGDTELTLRLMDDPWRWRERLVETFEFRSAQYVRVRSSYQVRLSRDLIDPRDELAARTIRVRMPVTTRPKQPLVGFNVEANDERAYLPLRTEIAATQAAYLGMLIASSQVGPAVSPGLTAPVLRAICSFTPGVYRGFTAWRHDGRLAAYLRAGLGIDITVGQVAHWRRMLEPVRDTLTAVLGEPPLQTSSSEEFLLAVPLVEPVPQSTDAVEALVASYAAAVAAADTSSDEVLLERLGDYGRRWEVLVDATLPVDEPRLVKVEEERPLGWRMGGHCTQRLWLADAPSYHLEARALDPAVVFRRKVEIRARAACSWASTFGTVVVSRTTPLRSTPLSRSGHTLRTCWSASGRCGPCGRSSCALRRWAFSRSPSLHWLTSATIGLASWRS